MAKDVVTTEQQIRDILSEDCALDEVQGIEHLENDRGLDSLDMTELYMKLEDAFGISIPEDDWDDLKTLQEITAYVEKKKAH